MKPFEDRLVSWYEMARRDLPWRRTSDPYRIWISEIMLQQTRVETVIAYYQAFLERFPDLLSLSNATEDEVLKRWEGLGYYSRARNIHRCAKDIIRLYGGRFPDQYDQIRQLPGIGDYTAGAIMSIAYNQPVPAVDGNVMRVVARHEGVEEDVSRGATRRTITEWVNARFPENASHFTQGLMELGAMVCLPKNPRCAECPVSSSCIAAREGRQASLPVKAGKSKPILQHMAFARVECGGRILMEKNQGDGLLSGLWTLPCVEVANPDMSHDALRDLLQKKWGLTALSMDALPGARHLFTHRTWEMYLFAVTIEETGHSEGNWFTREEIGSLALSRAVQKLLEGC